MLPRDAEMMADHIGSLRRAGAMASGVALLRPELCGRNVTSEQLVPIRHEEQLRAARVLGVTRVAFLGYEDGELEDTRDLRRDITREIRRWRPDLIITLNPRRAYDHFAFWHRDHRITGRVVLDCAHPLARDHLAFPELLPEYEPHTVREVHVPAFEARMRNRAETLGKEKGYSYAEGFDPIVVPG